MTRQASGGDAVKHVYAAFHHFKQIQRRQAKTHGVVGLVFWDKRNNPIQNLFGGFHVVTNAFAANGNAVKVHDGNVSRRFFAQVAVIGALNDAKKENFVIPREVNRPRDPIVW